MPDERQPKVFLLNSVEPFEQFHGELCKLLEHLGCRLDVATQWKEAEEKLNGSEPKGISRYAYVVLDPSVPKFDPDRCREWLDTIPSDARPKIVTIHLLPDLELADVDEKLGSSAAIIKNYSQQDLAFVFNRFFFPRSENKRRYPRSLTSIPVEVTDEKNGHSYHQETFNLSEGGTFVRSYTPSPIHSDLELTLHLPDEENPVECSGQVVFSHPYTFGCTGMVPSGMGIEFEEIDPSQKERLLKHVNRQLMLTDPQLRRAKKK